MINKSNYSSVITILAGALWCAALFAEEHTEEALKHADDAAGSVGDSRSIREHASEALRHIEAAKAANADNPEMIEHLEKGEAELKDAVRHASHYNSPTATDTAAGAKTHLENALNAADAKARPEAPNR